MNTTLQTIVLTCYAFVHLISYATLFFCFHHRSAFAPFRAKQLEALAIGTVLSTIWAVGALVTLRYIPQTGVFQYCTVNIVFLQLVFGLNAFIVVLEYRMLRMYYILVLGKIPKGYKFWGILLLSWIPSFVLGMVSLIYPGEYVSVLPVPDPRVNGENVCRMFTSWFKFGVYGTVLFQILILVILNLMVSGVNRSYNEFQEHQVSLVVFILILGINFLLNLADQSVSDLGAFAMIMSYLLIPITLLTISLGKPIYGFLFNRENYVREFFIEVESSVTSRSGSNRDSGKKPWNSA